MPVELRQTIGPYLRIRRGINAKGDSFEVVSILGPNLQSPIEEQKERNGWVIGSKLGKVLEVDVLKFRIQWGRCLRVHVRIDVTRRLVWGKKLTIE